MQATTAEDQTTAVHTLEDIRKLKIDLSKASLEELEAPVDTGPGSANSPSLLCSIFQPLFDLYHSTENFHLKVACCDALATWLTKAIKATDESATLLQETTTVFQGKTTFLSLYEIMLWDWDIGGPIHSPLREIFSKTLLLHKKAHTLAQEEQMTLLRDVLAMDRSQKSVYYALEILRKFLGTTAILSCQPAFFAERLQDMREVSIATPLGRLLSNIILEKLPSSPTLEDELVWLDLWQGPLTELLLTATQTHVSNVLTYLLSPLFKASRNAFEHFLRGLLDSESARDRSRSLLVLTHCLKKAKDVQVINDVDRKLLEKFNLPQDLLSELMTHTESAIRVAALDLLVSHPKTTTPFGQDVYDLLQLKLPYYFYETDMQYRKEVMDAMRAFFVRFQASLYSTKPLLKKADSQGRKDLREDLISYTKRSNDFAKWLVVMLKSNLEPGSGFQATYMSLQTLQLASGLGWHSGDPAICKKFAAFRSAAPSIKHGNLELPFDITLFDAEMIRLLLDCLSDSFDDNRTLSISILTALSSTLFGLENGDDLKLVVDNSQRLLRSVRGRDGDGGARTLQFLFERFILTENVLASGLVASTLLPGSSLAVRFIESILCSVDDDVYLARSNMLRAAQDHAIHGRLIAIRYMIEAVNYDRLGANDSSVGWAALHSHILRTSDLIWNVVQEVLCDDSPEGSLPVSVREQQSSSLRGPETQVVLSFCWRALREISNLLRTVVIRAPYTETSKLLKEQDFDDAGRLFQTWLTDVRHRGAFSAVFPNFVDIAKRLLKMQAETNLSQLPRIWLQNNIEQLKSPVHSKDITRRSGGLPMSIISLMLSEIESNSGTRSMIEYAMTQLINLVTSPVVELDDKIECPQVHGMNTLKDIFLESKLASCSIDYVERCFIISLDGFCSPLWAIRNCSLMLFSALLRRSFGAKLSRSESNTKTFSARAFFRRYPRVLQRLVEELRTAAEALFSRDAPSITTGLHPCLTLLSRLDLAETSDVDEDEAFESILNLLTLIATSQIWQVRSMAAQAVPTFVEPELVGSFIVQQLNQASTQDQNALHGRLLMINYLLQYNLDRYTSDRLFVDKILGDLRRAIISKLAEFTSENPCAATEAVWLRILLFLARGTRADMNITLRQRVVDYCARELEDTSGKRVGVIGAAELHKVMTMIIMRVLADSSFRWLQSAPRSVVLRTLMQDRRHEVRLKVYETLNHVFGPSSSVLRAPVLRQTLEHQCTAEDWPVTKSAAKRCLAKLPASTNVSPAESPDRLVELHMLELETQATVSPDIGITLVLIGQFVQRTNDVLLRTRYLNLLKKFDDDEIPLEARGAVLRSLEASTILRALRSTDGDGGDFEQAMSFVPLLRRLLTDDDEDLRRDSSRYICSELLECTPKMPEQVSELLLQELTMRFPNSNRLKEELLLEVVPTGVDPAEELSVALQPSGLLFAIESQNLWRNSVVQCKQALCGLANLTLSEVEMEPLVGWTFKAYDALRVQLDSKQRDGPLGWTSIPEVWQIIRRTILVSRHLLYSAAVSETTKQTLSDRLKELRISSQDLQLHPSLQAMLDRP